MFIACPQCRYLVAIDPRTQAAPARCPRCSAVLNPGSDAAPSAEAAASAVATAGAEPARNAMGGQSFVSLLRREEAPTEHGEEAAAPLSTISQEMTATDTTSAQRGAAATSAGADVADADADVDVDVDVDVGIGVDADADADIAGAHADAESEAAARAAVESNAEADAHADAENKPAKQPASARGPRAPAFLRGRSTTAQVQRGMSAWQWAAVIVLLLSLLLQMLLADRARLGTDAAWRPLLTSICQVLGCSMPPWREPQAFVMLDRDVRPLPSVAGVLQARATFRNDARWSQPWPILLLTLKDADGRDLGARAITPAEYLRGSTAMTELAPGQSAQVSVDIREPSANVVAFSFDFR